MYFYFDEVKKKIRAFNCLDKDLIVKICEKVKHKLSKYYNKIVNKDNTIYDIAMMLNFIQKISLFKR